MAPALKVSHLMAITLTDVAPSLRIARLPTGPTFSFRIERYSLKKDLLKASRSSRSQGLEYLTAPLVRRHISLYPLLFFPDRSHSLYSPLFLRRLQILPHISPFS